MTTHTDAALDVLRPDDLIDSLCIPDIETRAAPAARPAPADPIAAVVAAVNAQTESINAALATRSAPQAPAPTATPAPVTPVARVVEPSALADVRRARLEALRTSAREGEDLARRGRPDPLITERTQRINAAHDAAGDAQARELARLRRENADLHRRARRPAGPVSATGAGPAGQRSAALIQHRHAVFQYMRTGQEVFGGLHLREIERRAMNTEVGGEGGFLVHPEQDNGPIERLLANLSPMRRLATVRPISAASLKKPFNKAGTAATWVGERESRPETATPSIDELEFPAMELYAEPLASQSMLEDSSIDLEAWLAGEVDIAFAEAEGAAYVSGNGIKKPRGILGYDFVDNAAWAWGKVGYVKTGANGAFAAGATQADCIVNMPVQMKQGMRANASWLMNRFTMGAVKTLKDAQNRYVWGDGDVSKGIPNTLAGYVVDEDENMPSIAANAHAIAFGDWKRAYIVVDRLGATVLRDPYSAKPHVMFYTRKRVGGGVQNFEAFKTLMFAA